jgi:preprotein translocase subunit SecA
MEKLGMETGEAIEHPWVTRAIENAQKKVEGHNFDMRKQLLEYDDVANEQRKVIYEQRNELMETEDISEYVKYTREEVVDDIISQSITPQTLEEQWDIPQLEKDIESDFGLKLDVGNWLEEDDNLHEESLRKKILDSINAMIQSKEGRVGSENMRNFEKQIMLKVLDEQWKEHLANMDYLRQGIGLRGYAQKNPKQEYKREAFAMFSSLLESVKFEVISILAKVHVPSEEEMLEMERRLREQQEQEHSIKFIHADAKTADAPTPNSNDTNGAAKGADAADAPFVRSGKKVGRNESCPCGSGKKFKQCHGKI